MKIFKKVVVILLILLASYNVFTIYPAYASQASISVSGSLVKGEKFTVTVNIPSDAIGYQGKIKVVYKDGSVDETPSPLANFQTDLSHPGNPTATFTAKVAGEATITFGGESGSTIVDKDDNSIAFPNAYKITIKENATPVNNTQAPKNNTTASTNTTTPKNTVTNTTTTTTTEPKYTSVNETVVTTERVNVRKSPNGDKIATVNKGTELKRTGVGDNGWSKVEYNGQTAYISSAYLKTTTATSTTTKPTETEITFKDVNETVYTTERVNIRKSPNGDKITTVDKGTELKRTGTSTDWSRVEYNKQTAYISSKYVTTEKPKEEEVTINDVDETTMYATKNCNLREGPSTNTKVVGSLSKGEKITKTGISSDKKWTRLKYENKVVYVSSSLISSEKPKEEVENTVANTTNTVENTVEENTVSKEEILKTIKDEVGVLPEVGINPATVAFIIITSTALIVSLVIIYKKKTEN